MRLADLPTPCLVLDRTALRGNLERLQATASALGLALRVDLQAARSIDIARLAFGIVRDAGAATPGIAVSTLADAEYFAAFDVDDILYATCITRAGLDQLAKLCAAGASVLAATDDAGIARAIAAHPAGLRALIRVEARGAGGGLGAADPELPIVASHLGTGLAGLMAQEPPAATPGPGGAAGLGALKLAAERLAGLGHAIRLVSTDAVTGIAPGSVPSCVTEMQAGSGMFDGGALTILARITGRGPAGLRLDAGAVALGGAPGELLDGAGEASFGGAVVRPLWLEQSLVAVESLPGQRLPDPGDGLRVLPRRAALAAAAHDRYFVVDGGDEVVAVWPRVGGW